MKPVNPTAFPTDMQTQGGGMTLRDYFAAAALQAVLAEFSDAWDRFDVARHCYLFADAMLAERAKEAK